MKKKIFFCFSSEQIVTSWSRESVEMFKGVIGVNFDRYYMIFFGIVRQRSHARLPLLVIFLPCLILRVKVLLVSL